MQATRPTLSRRRCNPPARWARDKGRVSPPINRKKTRRLYREEGLTVRRRKGRRRAVGYDAKETDDEDPDRL